MARWSMAFPHSHDLGKLQAVVRPPRRAHTCLSVQRPQMTKTSLHRTRPKGALDEGALEEEGALEGTRFICLFIDLQKRGPPSLF